MNLRFLSALLIFFSAYSPLAIIFLIQDFDFLVCKLRHPTLVVSIGIIALVSCMILYFAVNSLKTSSSPIQINSVKNRSGELINYSIPYIVSFFAVDLDNQNMMLSFMFFMALMFWLTYKTHNIFINPILIMMGYGLYDVSYSKNGRDCSSLMLIKHSPPIKGDRCRIIEISRQFYLVTEINPEV